MAWYDYIPHVAAYKWVTGTDGRERRVTDATGKRDEDINQLLPGLQQQALGENQFSQELLRQGLQRNVAGQQAMAASARPGEAAGARRYAMQQGSRLGGEMAGQGALASIAERQAAQQQLQDLLLRLREQDIGASLGVGQFPTRGERVLGAAGGLTGAALMSDRAVKRDIKPGDDDADALLDGLRAYSYRYKDEKHGKGKQLGVMAQDLEAAGLPQAVVETPEGKAVDAGKLSGALAAGLARMHARVKRLEGESEGD